MGLWTSAEAKLDSQPLVIIDPTVKQPTAKKISSVSDINCLRDAFKKKKEKNPPVVTSHVFQSFFMR